MTQVKEMTNPELNLKLALLCGHEEITEREDVMNRRQRNDYEGAGVVVLYGDHYIVRANGKYGEWDHCTDPAASLGVQTAAIRADADSYISNLQEIRNLTKAKFMTRIMTADLMSASPREGRGGIPDTKCGAVDFK